VLSRVAEPADLRFGALIERCGAAEVLARIRSGDPTVPGVNAMRVRQAGVHGDALLVDAAALGVRFVCPGDSEWPTQLDDLGRAAPFGIWIRGRAGWRGALLRSVSMVGSRAATPYGVHVATELAAGVAEAGWSVVSGLAFGIDAAAHRGALAVSGFTVGVLAGGVDVPYPVAHTSLIERVADEGLVISEASLGAAPARRRFLTRNRLIAALTRGTIVVEAGSRSGAATTARWADELGRILMAVPGPITSAVSAGSNELLRSRQALAVTRPAEVIEAVGRLGADLAPALEGPGWRGDGLSSSLQQVLEAMPTRKVVSIAVVARECGWEADAVFAVLGELAALSLVERVDGGWRLTRHARARSREPCR
jgi:DNA processing protein